MSDIDYGPLNELIGVWHGDKGVDIAPEADGSEENNPYDETISYEAIGDVTNAESQVLAVLHYQQVVKRKENGQVFHHQSGYWSYDAKTKVITHSFTIPRGVAVVACGKAKREGNTTIINVAADPKLDGGGIVQSSFMQKKARTTAFTQQLSINTNSFSYKQSIMLDIYGAPFDHTDINELVRS